MFKPFAVLEVLLSFFFFFLMWGFFGGEGDVFFDTKKMGRVCSYIMLLFFLVLICLGKEFMSLSLVL